MPQRLLLALLSLTLFLAGCGGGDKATSTPQGAASSAAAEATSAASGAASSASAAADAASPGSNSTAAAACPTDNTKSFAKTRFVADVGGSLFLFRRYVYQPYQEGKFKQGASGRRTALIKAGVAGAAIVKLMKNATENAKADPTLCKSIAGPLSKATEQLGGLASGLATGGFNPSALEGVNKLFGDVKSGAKKAGVDVQEQEIPLTG